ncbi:hypothetical protein ILUMI_26568 [Ignelater luminosus]|uniref:Uncharacterized protein n=1 Tax=Ignelater luminosus TaxID=2038154 RepID=A0A8K0C5L7_IGNLU|nr:hypothetical protein ILUMI_26568 [Ignelater luminosus]
MLQTTLNINLNIKIEQYNKLRSLLKRKGEGYKPKKTRTFTSEQIHSLIMQAPGEPYLATKVALIMGIMRACRAQERHNMQIEDLKDLNDNT